MAKKKSMLEEMAETEVSVDMTPMIDVVFQLLIFFMCTLRFITLEGMLAAQLPKDVGLNASSAPQQLDKLKIQISYSKEKKKATFQAGRTNTSDRKDLLVAVKAFVGSFPGVPVEIAPQGDVPYRYLVVALDVCNEAKAKEIQFSGVAAPIK